MLKFSFDLNKCDTRTRCIRTVNTVCEVLETEIKTVGYSNSFYLQDIQKNNFDLIKYVLFINKNRPLQRANNYSSLGEHLKK